MGALTGRDAAQLARICGMLGSDHDGERANAAAFATRKLRDLGLTWEDLVSRAVRGAAAEAPLARQVDPWSGIAPEHLAPWAQICWLRQNSTLLSGWERRFAFDLPLRGRNLTPRQRAKLAEVVGRVVARGAGPRT